MRRRNPPGQGYNVNREMREGRSKVRRAERLKQRGEDRQRTTELEANGQAILDRAADFREKETTHTEE